MSDTEKPPESSQDEATEPTSLVSTEDLAAPTAIDDDQNGAMVPFAIAVFALTAVGTMAVANMAVKEGPIEVENRVVGITATAAVAPTPAAEPEPAAAAPAAKEASWELGQELFNQAPYVCNSCHSVEAGVRLVGPPLKGIWGKEETMADGTKVTVDEAYLKESILNPNAKVVESYAPAMPPQDGKLDDVQLQSLVMYIQHLGE